MKKKDFIVQDLLSKIYQKQYPANSMLPPERKLMEEYGVSRNTIRKALEKLKDIGIVSSVQGKGNAIQSISKQTSLIFSSITEKKSSQITSKVNYLRLKLPTKEERKIFDINDSVKIWEFQRVRIVDSKMTEIQHSMLPRNIFMYLDEKDLESSIQKLVTDMELNISHSIATFEAVNLNEQEARLLREKKGKAAMKVVSRGILKDGTVFEFTERVVTDYKGTFNLPFSKEIYDYRHKD